jgi:amino acid transporter
MTNGEAEPQQSRLKRNQLGTGGIVFMVLAAAGPLAAIFVGTAASVGFGNGIGTPGVYLLVSIVLALFAVGYVEMSRHVVSVGAFYAYVTKGLGRPLGFSTAILAVLAYNAYVVALVAFFGGYASFAMENLVHVHWAWQVWAAIGFSLVAVLSFFGIDLSAKVLGLLMACEVLVLLTLDIAILVNQGPGAFTLHAFSPGTVFTGAIGVSVIYGFSSFVGFEATAIYSEEAREPRKTVPRATYIAIAMISTFYVVTIWALIAGYGADHAVATARHDPENFVFALNEKYVGGFTNEAMDVLICTSLFAALLAFHNATARYMYALARDGVLPEPLRRIHPRFGSPYVSGAVQLAITAVIVIVCMVAGLEPLGDIAAGFLGLGALSIICLQGMTSVSVIGFFRRRGGGARWNTFVAPLLAALGLGAGTVLSIIHYSDLTGAETPLLNKLWVLVPAAILLGLPLAALVKRLRPRIYARFGDGAQDEESTLPKEGAEPSFGPIGDPTHSN